MTALGPVLAVKIDNIKEARPSKASDIGFRFGPLPAGGRSVPSYSVSYPAASFRFRWSRPSAGGGTTFTLPDGKRMLFAPGQV